jgi:nucleotidyltransferase substrate binding protein (TIGR01987 family)
MVMALQLDNMRKTLSLLERSLLAIQGNLDFIPPELQETLRAGVIQHFEVAYEQCWKMIRRWIQLNLPGEEIEHPRTRKDLFRRAAQLNLIHDPAPWFDYSEARNLTSHIYSEEKSLTVLAIVEAFLADAQHLLHQLESHND